MNLIQISDLTHDDIRAIWNLVKTPPQTMNGCVGWSFEGNGIRTRTSFIQAFRELGLSYIELPNLLKSAERVCDLAGYLDPFYALYVIRESNHQRLMNFAAASTRPVINAMSQEGHPCEVLTDACYLNSTLGPIEKLRIGLWGPTTNVFKSWHELAAVLDFEICHFCPADFHTTKHKVVYRETPDHPVDVLITDSWPKGFTAAEWSLTSDHLARMGIPKLLPTPPFFIGKELSLDPVDYAGFAGYRQKELLLPVQRAILSYMAGHPQ